MLHLLNHPLGAHIITHLRDRTTKPVTFRTLTYQIGLLLALESTREMQTKEAVIETPLEAYRGVVLGDSLVLVPILRAAIGLVQPFTDLFPDVSIGYVGLERDHETADRKGRRERALPLWKTTAAALRAWLAIRGAVASPELFVNARGTPFSRWGVAYVLRRHTETANRKCLTLRGKQVSPHVLRHTCAMIVLQATKDIRKVSLWLGHSDLTTTEVYVRADPTEKLEAIEAVVPPSLRKGKFRPPDKLFALLKVKP